MKLVLTDDTVEIMVFNRGITLFTSDDEQVRRMQTGRIRKGPMTRAKAGMDKVV